MEERPLAAHHPLSIIMMIYPLKKKKVSVLHAIALTMLPKVGAATQRQIINVFGTPEQLFSASRSDLSEAFHHHHETIDAILSGHPLRRAEEELHYCEKNHIQILYCTDRCYPQRLNRNECTDTPIVLYYLGTANLNAERMVAVVGTRRATEYGRDRVAALINSFKQEEITVVSGLAMGIDSAAHRAALANELPTVAVVGHGLEQIYPAMNRDLAKRIVKNGGGILTEYPHGTPINPGLFPARNRIIAALSDATVVAESSTKGGSLITANLATAYNRDVMAFPGRIGDPYSTGCNRIIASAKAQLIETGDDLFATMQWQRRQAAPTQTAIPLDLPPDELTLYTLIREAGGIITVQELKEKSDFSLPKVSTTLLNMELKSLVFALPGNRYKIT